MKIKVFTLLLALFTIVSALAIGPDKQQAKVKGIINEHFGSFSFGKLLFVDVSTQEMYVVNSGTVIQTFTISSSKYGEGEVPNSMKTPLGLHFVAKKLGDDADMNAIFKGRVNTKKKAVPNDEKYRDKDLITTRIMWLEGGEERNSLGAKSSMRRYIYIHGTPDEELLGRPASHGCIRMRNIDVYALYEFVDEGTPVVIWKDGYLQPDVIADLPVIKQELSKKEQKKADKLKRKEERRKALKF
jgi:hypothetical protein